MLLVHVSLDQIAKMIPSKTYSSQPAIHISGNKPHFSFYQGAKSNTNDHYDDHHHCDHQRYHHHYHHCFESTLGSLAHPGNGNCLWSGVPTVTIIVKEGGDGGHDRRK